MWHIHTCSSIIICIIHNIYLYIYIHPPHLHTHHVYLPQSASLRPPSPLPSPKQPMYANEYLCEWNIQPKDACSQVSLLMDVNKDFHDDGNVAANPSCNCNDHLEVNYNGGTNVDRYCGNSSTDNCPFNNCILPQLVSSEYRL